VLAHQGGWDEIALVAIPCVVLVALLRLARRRALAARAANDHMGGSVPDPDPTGGDANVTR
jgi:hypothetical protein